MQTPKKKNRLWPFLVMAVLGGALFIAQPFLGGGSTTAATPTPAPSGTPASAPLEPEATVASLATATATPATGPQAISSGDLLGIIAKLGLVLVVIVVTLYVLKLVMNRSRGGAGPGGAVRVIDTIGLGNNRAMYLVDVGEKVLVVGGTATQLNLLSELTDPTTLTTLRTPRTSGASVAAASMSDLLRRTTSRFARPVEGPDAYDVPAIEKLQRMLREQQAEPAGLPLEAGR